MLHARKNLAGMTRNRQAALNVTLDLKRVLARAEAVFEGEVLFHLSPKYFETVFYLFNHEHCFTLFVRLFVVLQWLLAVRKNS